MSDVFSSGASRVTVHGVEAFRLKMAELPGVLEKRVLTKMMRESMRQVQAQARATVPTLASPVLGRNGIPRRLPGTVRKAISVRTSKDEAKSGNVGVFVNVKPLKGNIYKSAGKYVNSSGEVKRRFLLVKLSSRGADNPRDPYYWRWLEFGTKARRTKSGKALGSTRPYAFLQSAAGKLVAAKDDFIKKLTAWAAGADKTGRIQ